MQEINNNNNGNNNGNKLKIHTYYLLVTNARTPKKKTAIKKTDKFKLNKLRGGGGGRKSFSFVLVGACCTEYSWSLLLKLTEKKRYINRKTVRQ
jgi:hypothetical protein